MGHVQDRWTTPGPDGKRARNDRWGKGKRWDANWVDFQGRRRRKAFTHKEAAQRHVDAHDHRGTRTPGGPITLEQWSQTWLPQQVDRLRPSTLERVESITRNHIVPHLGAVQLGDLTHEHVTTWLAQLTGAPATKRRIHSVLTVMLTAAVKAHRAPSNPAHGVTFKAGESRGHRYLTVAELDQLIDALPEHWRGFVLTLALTGLRVGEAAELRGKDIDVRARRISITRTATLVGGRIVVGPPKTGAGRRTVPIPTALVQTLTERPVGRDELVFTTPQGAQIHAGNFRRRTFRKATLEAGLEGLRLHDLRHTAVSFAVAAGASVKTVQRMVGHASAAMTLDTYAGLFDHDLDRVASRMDDWLARERQQSTTGDVEGV